MDEYLEEARREQRRDLEREATAAIELRARLPQLVQQAIARVLEEADDLEQAKEFAGIGGEEIDA
ncbi:hypothetical protein NP511_13515 [Natrinema thermotolerans]|uniref:Uncharacterized protein n=1 Tax=Natrinema thermotolerans TaxID=121872 RepID=A0AAF0P8D6_9EURY|nr:hypothetical protein [Natrinema thermotolerans]QCC59431.1 hypothetical protein DVR14_12645 [Natrinema thermotolerans]WMT06402.1 hypothetical protein NP511_13515 [Natrinema thermotolerans]